MKQLINIVLLTLIFTNGLLTGLNGQGEIQVDDIKVFKDFEAKLKDFKKVDLLPVIPVFDLSSRSYQYNISGRPIKLDYEKPSIRPLALPPIKEPVANTGLVRAAYGLPNAILAELAYSIKKGSMLAGFSLNHLSANNKNIADQRFYNNNMVMNLQNAFKNGLPYKAFADMNIDYYNLYGVESNADTNVIYDDPTRRFTHWDMELEIPSTPVSRIFDGQASVNYRFIHNNIESAYEHYLLASVRPEWNTGGSFSLAFPVEAETALADVHSPLGMLRFSPALVYNKPYFTFELGGSMGYANDYFIYPAGKISLNKIFTYFDIFAGVDQHIRINSLYASVKENPFMNFLSFQSNSFISVNYFAGLRGNVEGALFEVVAAYHQLQNLPLYGISMFDSRQFQILYDNGTDFSIQAEADYKLTESLSFNGRLANHFYRMEVEEKPWHRPALDANLGVKATLFDDKLSIEGSFCFMSGIFYKDVSTGVAERLPVIADFNFSGQYRVFKNTYAFLVWNNITASKYHRWYQYPSYRTLLLVGLKQAF